ncbi:metal ABC transporter substrate-binding protein [Halobellus salinisoli]|uniref:metal ABC transporter substrate-binding protein n=1 Tax=Halobellus salinisoli TaxID=3108500 RepID=UPI00300BCDF8
METTRRRLLVTVAGAATLGITAGCVGGSTDTQSTADETSVQSSFFVFGDVARTVAGDAANSELLVPIGQHGHGWEPGPRVREDVYEASLLVHGMAGFQPWVDDIRRDLDADGSSVTTVDASSGLDLLAAVDEHDHAEDNHAEDDHTEGDHEDEAHTDDAHHEEPHEDDSHLDDHDHENSGTADPHFWMDPLRLAESVGTVRDALIEVDADDADAYESNAEAFRSALHDLHDCVEAIVSEAAGDVLLIAGHNSLRYFGDRYDVEIEALTQVSPDDQVTVRDVERAQERIERNDLRYICADPLESQRAAEQLVEETDAEAVLPLTSMPGLTDEWDEEGWGYLEVMESVNLPTIERVLTDQ